MSFKAWCCSECRDVVRFTEWHCQLVLMLTPEEGAFAWESCLSSTFNWFIVILCLSPMLWAKQTDVACRHIARVGHCELVFSSLVIEPFPDNCACWHICCSSSCKSFLRSRQAWSGTWCCCVGQKSPMSQKWLTEWRSLKKWLTEWRSWWLNWSKFKFCYNEKWH